MKDAFIPLARPNITDLEVNAVTAVLKSPNLSLGPKLTEFEQAFATYCNTKHAVACSSGTAALHMLMIAAGVDDQREVITTPFSFIASANCILQAGGKPVFVDVDPDTWNIDAANIESAITANTKAIIPVDVFGQIADFDAIMPLAKQHGLFVVEDSCEALGSKFNNTLAGAFGDAGVFGFYPNKQLTTGEGGMIVTDDQAIADHCRSLRNQGRDVQGGWLAHPRLGFNYRLSDINCALGIAQLERMADIISARSQVERLYRKRLIDEPRIRMQRVNTGMDMSWFVFVVRLDDKYDQQDRDRMLMELTESGIGCSNYFAPIHLQPFYVSEFGFKTGDFPVCENLAARTIALPFHHELTENDVNRICESLQKLL